MEFTERYTITEVPPEEGCRVFHVLDESRVSPTRAPKSASRYYRVWGDDPAYEITRTEGGVTRHTTVDTCDCPFGERGALCIHRLIVWWILARAARGFVRVPYVADAWEGRS